ncbi:tripartite tricarboxylate transporter substrate binding protein [Candidimonas humi]|jgi:tripartite-type tricarboxylate transporter receptor subunit TctC|uniref:Bug family tripartite tricarboxylate transporter substrate binding protein n=1 Tax=Candidimonas humi TaxID=683355 RepID=A0ABV8P5E6_9BURK|nr:tripartite tricarboxylate transporter substrate binding protein [Candidimonas humi]MBV6307205.1 tripartite tricarboxylate transporter substrate binding protein [Candidimonas humi]
MQNKTTNPSRLASIFLALGTLTRRTLGRSALACLGGLALSAACSAATVQWPQAGKPVRLIVPFPAGSGSDTLARMLAQTVSQQTGASVIVENKPGASTIIGAETVAHSAPDGNTLLYTIVVTHTQNPHLYKKLPYDPFKDFTPIEQFVRSATILEANKNAPFNTTHEMIAYAKAHPGKLNFGSYSIGSTSHLNGEILKRAAHIDIVHVPYKGTADASRALLAGEVQIYFDGTATAVENFRAGKVKLLGTATPHRLKVLPKLQTFDEQGIKGLDIVGWQGLFGPGNMPPALAERIATVFRKALETPAVIKFVEANGNEVSGAGPKAFNDIVHQDYVRWGKVIEQAHITLD